MMADSWGGLSSAEIRVFQTRKPQNPSLKNLFFKLLSPVHCYSLFELQRNHIHRCAALSFVFE